MIKIKKYQIENYISDATQNALNLKADLVDGKVPSSQLPSYVDDVIEVPNYASLPNPGATGIIYVTLNNNKVYRWGGTDYIEIAFGVANLSYTPGISSGVVNSDTGTDATIPLAGTTNAGLFSAAEKTKLEGIATGANVGVIPNTPITGATKTKITYDSKGLVTAGADATTADVADSTNKRYVTDSQKTVIGNTSGTNTGDQNLQQVLDKGNTATDTIIINPPISVDGLNINTSFSEGEQISTAIKLILNGETSGINVTANEGSNALIISGNYNTNAISVYDSDVSFASVNSTIGLTVGDSGNLQYGAYINNANGDYGVVLYQNIGAAIAASLGSSAKGLVIDSGTSSTGNFIELNKNGVNKFTINQNGEQSIVKIPGGLATEYLMADGSVTTGGGGNTDLGYTPSPTNGIVTSSTGADATIPLANSTNAGLITAAEKTKLSGIATGAEVNVNADWNATSGDAQILNKPTIPSAVTQTSQLTNNGADGLNPFITALDIPTTGTASTIVREVKNMTGATLTKGTVVYISGANGNKALVSKALATTDALSARTFGLLQSDILNNGLGNCVIIGDLTGVNTSSFTEGAQLYLSGTTAGTYTSTKTLAPTHLVYVGKVTRVHPTQGQIEVGVQNGYELEEIHDVQIITPINDDFLQYESSTDLWKNKQITDTLIKSKLGISVLSGSNTGDNATNAQYSGLETSKQDILVSGTNIKTINGNTILGSGNLPIGTVTSVTGTAPLVSSGGTTPAISMAAATASVDGYLTSANFTTFNNKQDKLLSSYSMIANNTASAANATTQAFKNLTNQTYTGTIVWGSVGTAPTGTTTHTYSISQIGNLVTLTINLAYGTAGAATLTTVGCELPNTAPTPALPTSVSAAGNVISYGTGMMAVDKSIPTVSAAFCALRIKSTSPDVFEVAINRAAAAYRYAYITIQYFTT